MKPSVSVCMATYNGSDYIREQLDSILPQLNDDDEIVIKLGETRASKFSTTRENRDSRRISKMP